MICITARQRRKLEQVELVKYLEPERARLAMILEVPGGFEDLRQTCSFAFTREVSRRDLQTALARIGALHAAPAG